MLKNRKKRYDNSLFKNDRGIIDFIIKHLQYKCPENIEGIDAVSLQEMVGNGLKRAKNYGLHLLEDLTAFVSIMFEIAPNFDKQPDIHNILKNSAAISDKKLDILFKRVPDKAWEEAEKNYSADAWYPALEKENSEKDRELFICVVEGDIKGLSLAFKKGLNPNAISEFGESALILAAMTGQVQCGQLLVGKGASINFRNETAKSALHIASANGRIKFVKFLLEHPLEINAQDIKGLTPLMMAAIGKSPNHIECASLLLEKGADISIKNNDGLTAFDLAKSQGASEMVVFLEGYSHNKKEYFSSYEYQLQHIGLSNSVTFPNIKELSFEEKKIWQRFPNDYKEFLKRFNGGVVANAGNVEKNRAYFLTRIPRKIKGKTSIDSNNAVEAFWAFLPLKHSAKFEKDVIKFILYQHEYQHKKEDFLPMGVMAIGECMQGSLICISLNRLDYGAVYYWEWYWRYPSYKYFFEVKIDQILKKYPDSTKILNDSHHPRHRELKDELNYATIVKVANSFTNFIVGLKNREEIELVN